MSDTKVIVDKLWNYCNVLRDDGLSYGDYVESGDLVPGLVADPDVCGGALRIDGTRLKVDELARTVEWAAPDVSPLTTCDSFAVVAKVAPELVRVAARVGGAL